MRNDEQVVFLALKFKDDGFHAHCQIVIRLTWVSTVKQEFGNHLLRLVDTGDGTDLPHAS